MPSHRFDDIHFNPYRRRRKYPHLGKHDRAIWDRFVLKNPDFFDKVAYDVVVGDEIPLPESYPEYMRNCAQYLCSQKCDVVALRSKFTYIIEIKPVIDITAPGQVLAYKILFENRYPQYILPIPLLLYEKAHPNVEKIAIDLHVLTMVVPQ